MSGRDRESLMARKRRYAIGVVGLGSGGGVSRFCSVDGGGGGSSGGTTYSFDARYDELNRKFNEDCAKLAEKYKAEASSKVEKYNKTPAASTEEAQKSAEAKLQQDIDSDNEAYEREWRQLKDKYKAEINKLAQQAKSSPVSLSQDDERRLSDLEKKAHDDIKRAEDDDHRNLRQSVSQDKSLMAYVERENSECSRLSSEEQKKLSSFEKQSRDELQKFTREEKDSDDRRIKQELSDLNRLIGVEREKFNDTYKEYEKQLKIMEEQEWDRWKSGSDNASYILCDLVTGAVSGPLKNRPEGAEYVYVASLDPKSSAYREDPLVRFVSDCFAYEMFDFAYKANLDFFINESFADVGILDLETLSSIDKDDDYSALIKVTFDSGKLVHVGNWYPNDLKTKKTDGLVVPEVGDVGNRTKAGSSIEGMRWISGWFLENPANTVWLADIYDVAEINRMASEYKVVLSDEKVPNASAAPLFKVKKNEELARPVENVRIYGKYYLLAENVGGQ